MSAPDPHPAEPALGLGPAALFYAAILAVAVIASLWTQPGLALLTAQPRPLALPWWLAGAGAGLGIVIATALVQRRSQALQRLADELAEMVAPVTWPRVAVLALLSGICEESLFRGPLQHAIGLLPAALAFALLHGGLARRYLAWSAFALVAGLAFGLLADAYASILPAALAHIVVNAINLRRLGRAAGQGGGEQRG